MSKNPKYNIIPLDKPPEPGKWRWLGNYNDVDHLWVYEEGKGYITYDLRIKSSSLGYDGKVRDRISGTKIMGLTGFDNIERAFGWANSMMLQIDEEGELVEKRVDMKD